MTKTIRPPSTLSAFLHYVSLNMLAMLGTSCYILADTFFVANGIGEDGLTALNLVLPLFNLMNATGLMIGIGGATKYAIHKARGEQEAGSQIFFHALLLAGVASVVFMLVGLLGADPLCRWLGSDAATHDKMVVYLRTLYCFAPLFLCNQLFAAFVRNDGAPNRVMLGTMLGTLGNIVLDYLFIFGIGPFPKLGVIGAALATVIARYIEAFIIIIWAHSHKEKNRYLEGAYTGFGMPKGELKAIIIKGFPLMFNEVLWAAGMTTVTQCYSIRGLEVVAGLNIATTITNLFNIIYIQLGACISIVVGQYLGAGELKKAKDADNKMIVFSVFCCALVAGVMLVIGRFFPQIYNTSEQIKELATSFIAVSAIIMPFCSFSHASYFTLRSGGKTLVTFLFDSVFTWVVVVPIAFVLAHYTGLGIVSVYFFVQATELIKVAIGYFMVRSNVWLVQMV